jgi:hypothetical protein
MTWKASAMSSVKIEIEEPLAAEMASLESL